MARKAAGSAFSRSHLARTLKTTSPTAGSVAGDGVGVTRRGYHRLRLRNEPGSTRFHSTAEYAALTAKISSSDWYRNPGRLIEYDFVHRIGRRMGSGQRVVRWMTWPASAA